MPALVMFLAITARLLPGARTIDDSYITYRYARNILAGSGPVYNPGERVLGTTTPLYTGLMALMGSLAGGENAPFPQLAMGINAIFDGLTCVILLTIGKHLGSNRAGLGAALVWAILPYSVTFAIGGLETSLYVLLLTATIWAYITRGCDSSARHTLTALFAALSLLTRPDALILIGLLALQQVSKSKINNRKSTIENQQSELLTFLLPTLAWITFATLYYGSPVPHSIAAKSAAYKLASNAALIRLLQHYATPFMGSQTFGVFWIGVGLFLYPFLFLIGLRQAIRANPRIWPWLAYPWLYFAVYAIANPLIFRWYLTPPLPPYILAILLGADRLLGDITSGYDSSTRKGEKPGQLFPTRQAIPILFVIVFPVLLSLQDWQLHPDHGPRMSRIRTRPAPEMAWYKLELRYRQAADLLAPEFQNTTAPRTLAAGDVGVLGYFTGARILDTVGLISPVSTPYYPTEDAYYVNAYAVSPNLIIDQHPDFVVLLEVYGREGLFKDPRFLENYRLRLKIPTDIYDSDGMLIFER
ncbi:MAG: hypothetical protein ACE5GO_07010, partial [Anaerolineales bacterium]